MIDLSTPIPGGTADLATALSVLIWLVLAVLLIAAVARWAGVPPEGRERSRVPAVRPAGGDPRPRVAGSLPPGRRVRARPGAACRRPAARGHAQGSRRRGRSWVDALATRGPRRERRRTRPRHRHVRAYVEPNATTIAVRRLGVELKTPL